DAALCRSALAALRERRWLPTAVAPQRGHSEGASQGRPATKADAVSDGGPKSGPSAEARNSNQRGGSDVVSGGGPTSGAGATPRSSNEQGDSDGVSDGGPSAEPRNRPTAAVVVDAAEPELVAALGDVLPGLLPADWSGRGVAAALAALGVRRLSVADVVEL